MDAQAGWDSAAEPTMGRHPGFYPGPGNVGVWVSLSTAFAV